MTKSNRINLENAQEGYVLLEFNSFPKTYFTKIPIGECPLGCESSCFHVYGVRVEKGVVKEIIKRPVLTRTPQTSIEVFARVPEAL